MRNFTTKSIEALKPDQNRRIELPDPALSGLYLVVQPSGSKSWAFRYRADGKPRKLTLGKWPKLGLANARAAAGDAKERVAHGQDPANDKQAAKRAARAGPDRDTFAALVAEYERKRLSKIKSGKTVARELRRFAVERWAGKSIQDLARRDVVELLEDVADSGRGATSNRLRTYLNTFFAWCVEREVIRVSPSNGIRPLFKEVSRERILTNDEIRWFCIGCADLGFPWGDLGMLLLLTGQRLGEVTRISEREIDGTLWQLPGHRTKNGREHEVRLSVQARDILAGMIRIESASGLYFTTTGDTPLSGFHKGRQRVADAMHDAAAKEQGKVVEIPHWTFHDLRRTMATGLQRIGVPLRHIEAVLNHVSGSASGIVATYQRYEFADEKALALESWGTEVDRIRKGKSVDIIPFYRAQK